MISSNKIFDFVVVVSGAHPLEALLDVEESHGNSIAGARSHNLRTQKIAAAERAK